MAHYISRPSGDMIMPGAAPSSGSDGFAMVNEVVADEETTTLIVTSGSALVYFSHPTVTLPDGDSTVINSITPYLRCKNTTGDIQAGFHNGSSPHYEDTGSDSPDAWFNHFITYTVNPYTSLPWVLSEFNALGFGGVITGVDYTGYCTQIWADIDYEAAAAAPAFVSSARFI